MIAVILGTLRARWGQAVTLAVLAVVAAGSAVVGPAYLHGVDRAGADHAVATATVAERSLTLTASVQAGRFTNGPDFARIGTALVAMPGFTSVFSSEVNVLGLERSQIAASALLYRQNTCDHLTMVAGRCLAGGGEIVVGEHTAARLALSPGDRLTLVYTIVDPIKKTYVPAGAPYLLTIAGVYRVTAPDELYWGGHGYFAPDLDGNPGEPVLTDRGTFTTLAHDSEQDTVDVQADPGTIGADRVAQLRAQLDDIKNRLLALGFDVSVSTSMPDLLDRIDANRHQAHELVPVAAVPLLVLAWFVILLAVGYGTAARRRELGLLALRGTRPTLRWTLAAGEHLVPIVIGTAVGYPLGLLAAQALAHARLHQPAGSGGVVRYAVAAGAGAVIAALLAQGRELVAPVGGLLRRISRSGGWRSATVEAVIVVLAVAAALSLRAGGGRLTGVGILVPTLVILAISLLAARAVIPLARVYGRRALRRGRIGGALAALQMGRRGGVNQLFVLLVAAVALLGFATTAVGIAKQAREDRAEITSGASRVLTVRRIPVAKLLAATHAVDPGGRYAMAAVTLPTGAPGELPRIAVDTARLATVPAWRSAFGGPSPEKLAPVLRTPLPAPLVVTGGRVELDVDVSLSNTDSELVLNVELAPLSGDWPVNMQLGPLVAGPQTLGEDTGACRDGCRLVGFGVTRSNSGGSFGATLTVHALRTAEPTAVAIPATQWAATGDWRAHTPSRTTLTGAADGLHIKFAAEDGTREESWIAPADVPLALPVAATSALPSGARMVGLDGLPTPVEQVARLSGLPRLGRMGAVVDLGVADRISTDTSGADDEEVWLGPDAPADVVDRLKHEGLVVTGDTALSAVRAGLDASGGSLALTFYLLAAALVVLLAAGGLRLVAAVDRDRGASDLRALRVQGVPGRLIGRAGLLGYLVVVVAALVVGPLAAVVAWLVAGGSLPTAAGDQSLWLTPRWPAAADVFWPWAVAAAILVAVALVAAFDLRRKVRQPVGLANEVEQ